MVNSPKIVLESALYHLIFTHCPSDYFINKDGIRSDLWFENNQTPAYLFKGNS